MRRFTTAVRGLLPVGALAVAIVLLGGVVVGGMKQAHAEDCLRPAQPGPAQGMTLIEIGERALGRLPWDTTLVTANLSAQRPVAVSAAYLMSRDLIVITQTGMVYCLARRDLTPRWVQSLKAPLAAVPGEGPDYYTFLVKAHDGAYWIHAFSKRSGSETSRFPARLPFAASSGTTNDASHVWVGSLGSPRDNRTVEAISLVTGRVAWGWRTRGLMWAAPVLDPSGNSLIVAAEDGTVASIAAGASEPETANWAQPMSGAVTATPVVTPEHVVVGDNAGVLRCLDLGDGQVRWLEGLDAPIRTSPWVLGRRETISRPSDVEGAPDIQVQAYLGVAFARNRNGLHAFDLSTGEPLFHDKSARRPICRNGQWIVTMDRSRMAGIRNANADYETQGRLSLTMFDLIPSNSEDGAIYGITHDGGIVAAIPTR